MIPAANALPVNSMYLRHDLLIEMGRLEMAIEDIRQHRSPDEALALALPLENRLASINETWNRLSA